MIHISNFDAEYKGKIFIDKSIVGTEYICVGYGDNQGNPYLVGLAEGSCPNRVTIKTVLLKNVEFVPAPTAT